MGIFLDTIKKDVVAFASLLPEPMGSALDSHFEKNGWELQAWDTGSAKGYQIFFGTGVQVDNYYEYGFPYLYDREELFAFAKMFYEHRVCEDTISLKAKSYLAAYFGIDKEESATTSEGLQSFEAALGFSYSEAIDVSSDNYMLDDICLTYKANFDVEKTEDDNWKEAVRITVQGYQYAELSLDAQIHCASSGLSDRPATPNQKEKDLEPEI